MVALVNRQVSDEFTFFDSDALPSLSNKDVSLSVLSYFPLEWHCLTKGASELVKLSISLTGWGRSCSRFVAKLVMTRAVDGTLSGSIP